MDLSELTHGFLSVVTWIWKDRYGNFSQLFHGFVKIDKWIFLNGYMDLWKSLHGFIKVLTWISLSSYIWFVKLVTFYKVLLCITRHLPKKTEVSPWFQCFIELKVLNESKYWMPWVRCTFGNFLSCKSLHYIWWCGFRMIWSSQGQSMRSQKA